MVLAIIGLILSILIGVYFIFHALNNIIENKFKVSGIESKIVSLKIQSQKHEIEKMRILEDLIKEINEFKELEVQLISNKVDLEKAETHKLAVKGK